MPHITPVELTSFTANTDKEAVILNWTTSTETNNKGFEVQKSVVRDQKSDWVNIGFINGNGTTTEQQNYKFEDKNIIAGKPAYRSGRYLYRLKQIDFDGSYKYSKTTEVNITAPEKFSLQQNYPNPFNPATTIKYGLPDQTRKEKILVTLKVYDVLGNEVTTLVNEQKEPGRYTTEFDGSKLSSGVYLYVLKTGNYIETKKMVLLK